MLPIWPGVVKLKWKPSPHLITFLEFLLIETNPFQANALHKFDISFKLVEFILNEQFYRLAEVEYSRKLLKNRNSGICTKQEPVSATLCKDEKYL